MYEKTERLQPKKCFYLITKGVVAFNGRPKNAYQYKIRSLGY